jgi:hypothetical protein
VSGSVHNFSFGSWHFADESFRACAAHMPAYQWWASWGGTLPELRELAMRVLAQPVGAGAGERNGSTYGFYCGQEEAPAFCRSW